MPLSLVALAVQFKWQLVTAATLVYVLTLCIYRRFFHPLAKTPGPFLASVSMLYQTWYNKRYYRQIARLHEKYGPVVRITPNEIHLSDPENYDKIYYIGTKYSKSANFYNAMSIPKASFGTISNELHRIRRGAMNSMFARKMVLELESTVQDKARKVCERMQEGIEKGVPVDLHNAFRAVSVDVITGFAFNKCYDLLELEDLGSEFFRMVRGSLLPIWVFRQFPTFHLAALKIPPWIMPYLSKPLAHLNAMQQGCVTQIEDVKTRMAAGKYTERPTIFSSLLTEDDKPRGYVVPSTTDLKDEAFTVLAAAADTTGNALTVAAFHVMSNPHIYQSLLAELEKAFPHPTDDLEFVKLEKLPYLTGVIKEGLRLSFGVIGRLPRAVPEPGATFNGYFVPAGTIVGMSSWIMQRNPDIFPDPMKFDPERWLDREDYKRLDHHMVPFGRGSRMCMGMPLAYCELYVTLGTFFRRFPGLQVFETTPADMEYDDYFGSYHIPGKKWFKAVGTGQKAH